MLPNFEKYDLYFYSFVLFTFVFFTFVLYFYSFVLFTLVPATADGRYLIGTATEDEELRMTRWSNPFDRRLRRQAVFNGTLPNGEGRLSSMAPCPAAGCLHRHPVCEPKPATAGSSTACRPICLQFNCLLLGMTLPTTTTTTRTTPTTTQAPRPRQRPHHALRRRTRRTHRGHGPLRAMAKRTR